MRIAVLTSGSKGNSSFIESENQAILIDAGMSAKRLLSRMDEVVPDDYSPRLECNYSGLDDADDIIAWKKTFLAADIEPNIKTANQEIKQSLNYIPKELRVILEIATEELPEKRYDSIEQFKSDIEKFMRGEEIDFERKTLFNRIKDIFHF